MTNKEKSIINKNFHKGQTQEKLPCFSPFCGPYIYLTQCLL